MNTPFIDIKLKYSEKGYHDIVINDYGDIEADNSFDTSVLLALGTDARASNEEIGKVEKQRGCIQDLFTNSNNGSKLWLLEQSRNDTESRNKAIDYALSALDYFKKDGYAQNVNVQGSLTGEGISLMVVIQAISGAYDKYRFDAWNNSIYRTN